MEVRIATAAEVPKVAATYADAFTTDPVLWFLCPGRLRQKARLRTMFETEIELYVLRNGGRVGAPAGSAGADPELPPGRWEMAKTAPGKEALRWLRAYGTRLPRALK